MESIFNQIFEYCADSEKLHNQNKDKFLYKLFGYKRIKKSYKELYKIVNQIGTIEDNFKLQLILSDYIDILSISKEHTGHCKSIDILNPKEDKKSITFEYNSGINKVILICIKDKNKNIFCNFRISQKGKELIQFDKWFDQLLSKNDNKDIIESELSEAAEQAQISFIPMIKDDITRYLNGFILDSEGRININGKKRSNKDTK